MPNPSMRDARDAAANPPTVYTTDVNGVRDGPRPKVGPADPATVHAALQAQRALATSPRPVAQATTGDEPADTSESPTKDLRLTTAANRLQTYGQKVDAAINDQSQ